MIKLVVFDWNGTLLSDTRACLAATNEVLKLFKKKPLTLQAYRATINAPVIEFYVQHGIKRDHLVENTQELSHIFHTFYEKRAQHCRTRAGARATLIYLKRHNIQGIILSNHTVAGITTQLKRLKLDGAITTVLANSALDTVVHGKNKLEKLQAYLRKEGIKPHETLIIGDSTEEIEVGKALGLTTVALCHGYYAEHRLRALHPDYVLGHLGELCAVLANHHRAAQRPHP